ncbi:MAG TPA: zf-HC2 domain-containing protein [Methylophilaceae bacterium]|nr:zf-HC2 domain-containing protein [Methylophilaceae bacterium]
MKLKDYMLSCKQASQLVSQSFDRPISVRERLALGFHLMICKFCRRFARQLLQISRAIHSLTRHMEQDESLQLSPQAKQRIVESLESSQGPNAYK